MTGGRIHKENPFIRPEEDRDPARRLRGRLSSSVTILTAGHGAAASGVTVSSIMVAEGSPAHVIALVGEESDFWEQARETGRFVVHVLGGEERAKADEFAGLRPRPGGPFAGREVLRTEWGDALADVASWAGCRVERWENLGDRLVLVGLIDRVELHDLADPLIHFRGAYRRLQLPDDR